MACIVGCIPKRKNPRLQKTAQWTIIAATVLVHYGLYEFVTNDFGITEGVRRLWEFCFGGALLPFWCSTLSWC